MRRVTLSALLIAILASNGVTAGDADGPKFKKGILGDAIRFVSNDSDDGQASTIIFDNFEIATDGTTPSGPDVEIKMFTYVRQIESTEDSRVKQNFRGFVSRDGNASVTMIVHSGGQTTVIDLKKAIENASKNTLKQDSPTRKKAEQAADDQGFDDDEGDADDFFASISTWVPKGQSLQTTIILLIDRVEGDDESGALLVLDSINSQIKTMPKKKN